MKTLAFLLSIAFSGVMLAAENSELVKVYCFSDATEAGFEDKETSDYCEDIQKRGKKKKSLVFVDNKESADVLVKYVVTEKHVGQGDKTTYYAGTATTQEKITLITTMVIIIGDFERRFSDEFPEVIYKVEEWIRENRDVILEKAKKK